MPLGRLSDNSIRPWVQQLNPGLIRPVQFYGSTVLGSQDTILPIPVKVLDGDVLPEHIGMHGWSALRHLSAIAWDVSKEVTAIGPIPARPTPT